MPKKKIAIPTDKDGGLDDSISTVLGRAKTFTIIDLDEEKIENIDVIKNPAQSYEQGVGPIVFKLLADLGVNTVIATEFGPGISTLFKHSKISKFKVKPDMRVNEAVKKFLE
jgi:predicted Fe-Mo cluster-binding NifX family protein